MRTSDLIRFPAMFSTWMLETPQYEILFTNSEKGSSFIRLKDKFRDLIEVFFDSAFASASSATGGKCMSERFSEASDLEKPSDEQSKANVMPSILQWLISSEDI